MISRRRVVFDTNVLVSRVLLEDSEPGRAVRHAEKNARILASTETFEEFRSVLLRPKFDRYANAALRLAFIERYQRIVESISIPSPIRACRDPKDDKFIELGVYGEANLLITGDRDLLVLSPFRGIEIVSPAAYLTLAP